MHPLISNGLFSQLASCVGWMPVPAKCYLEEELLINFTSTLLFRSNRLYNIYSRSLLDFINRNAAMRDVATIDMESGLSFALIGVSIGVPSDASSHAGVF
jgi:hypothetical protein